jgi:CMP/dCMP kinase
MIIAIDGPAASGKGTLGKRLAAHYGLAHLDTGLLYRAVAYHVLQAGHDLGDEEAATKAAQGLDVAALDEHTLRGRPMGDAASIVSAFSGVRTALLALQRDFARDPRGAVLDGRDIGTIICPQADVKLFVTATAEERAKRRFRELHARGEETNLDDVLTDILRRDARDSQRSSAPLRQAEDAHLLDSTTLDADETLAKAISLIDAIAPAK